MTDRDIVDRIDELVDEQLSRYDERTGYDYNVRIEECWHCGGDWHGLPITERVRVMRIGYCGCPACADQLDQYRVDEDDSPIWCPGSEFIGPWATPQQLRQIRRARESAAGTWRDWTGREWTISAGLLGDASWELPSLEWIDEVDVPPELQFPPLIRGAVQFRFTPMSELMLHFGIDPGILTVGWTTPPPREPEPDARTPQERALPRPSTEPPMWAVQPNRQRRRRNR